MNKTEQTGLIMQMTYDEALGALIEHTEIGYTLAGQDKVWIVFTFDLDSDGERRSLRYNRLYPMTHTKTGVMGHWAYDLDMQSDGWAVPVFTTRGEAEHFANDVRAHLNHTAKGAAMAENVYVMNLGDDARYEKTIIGPDGGTRPRTTPKFKGSEAAWQAMEEMTARWREANLT